MANHYLLDTNAVIARMNADAAIRKIIVDAEDISIPAPALAELFFGAEKSGKRLENMERIESIAATEKILSCDSNTARIYGRINQQLRSQGRPIPTNDVWIAAIGIQHQLTIITRDKHFSYVDDLKTIAW